MTFPSIRAATMDSWIIERFVQDIFFLRDFHAPLLLLSVFIGSWAPIIRLELQAPFEILIVRSDFRSKCQCEKKIQDAYRQHVQMEKCLSQIFLFLFVS